MAKATRAHAHPSASISTNRVNLQGRSESRSHGNRWLNRGFTLAVAVVLFAISLGINLANIEATELHPDETRWINRAYYIREFSEPFGMYWQDYYITRGQPPGGSYLMGLGLWLQGQPLDSNGVWDFHFSTEWNEMAGAVPEHDVLMAGRRTNAVVGALVVVLAFIAATQLTNRFGGILAGLFLAYHPLHITLSTQALSDELLALSLGVAFVAAFRYGQSRHPAWAIVLGIALGVGGATKLAPLALAFVLAGYGAVWLALTVKRNRRRVSWADARYGMLLLIQPAIAGFVFVAMYPFLWPNPVSRSLDLLDFRRQEMASQARIWPWAKVETPKDAFMRYGEQLDGTYSTTKHLQQSLLERIGIDIANPVGLDFIAVAIGAILLGRMVIRTGLWSPQSLMALLMAAEIGAVTVGLGVDFYRYYLPILLVNSILVGVAFGEIWSWAYRSWARRSPNAHHSRSVHWESAAERPVNP
ncbi:MAG TPA: phospholipid carrier-dependent glycosyltransferase [Thermomicrobiales bacterium]|nr:phospholipid carrier-dependent glycosyltransferase [Thermomicrobiales bacterium]